MSMQIVEQVKWTRKIPDRDGFKFYDKIRKKNPHL